jgi:hypothetical protein
LAAIAYKNAGKKTDAATAYEKLSYCKEKLGECVPDSARPCGWSRRARGLCPLQTLCSQFDTTAACCPTTPRQWLAGKHLESSAACAKEAGTMSADELAGLYRRACTLYVEASRPQTGADALVHGGKAVEAKDAGLAVELYLEACGIYEEEGKEPFAMDTYRAAASAMAKMERWHDCITVLLRHAGACDKTGSNSSLCKCYLSAVIVYLAMGDPVNAEHGYYDYMELPQFEKSEEARAAWELLDAYGQCDEAALKKAVSRGVFTGLEQVFIKLAKKLPLGDFAKQAAALNAARGGGPSADAVELDDDNLT